jgi:xylulokinase
VLFLIYYRALGYGKNMSFLGIDIGTGGSRAVLIDELGKVISSATIEHIPFASPETGWAEQDPNDWRRASSEAIKTVCSDERVNVDEISAVGLSGQMHGSVLLDQNDEVIRPAIIWCDQRTEKQCKELNKTIGEKRLLELVCNPALTNFTLTKLLWIRENEPGNWARVSTVLLPKDYIQFRMTGEKATDVSDASGTLMLDVRRRQWSTELLSELNIDKSILPRVFESHEVTGTITPEYANETGLNAGTQVVAGAGDNAAGAIGMGIVNSGDTSVTIGTSGVVFTVTDRPKIDWNGRIHTFCHAIPGRWHLTGVTQAAGLSFRWFRENCAGDESYDELVAEAALIPHGANGLLWTPYLMGERTPHIDPQARASLIGLTASHTRAHIVRAILEGVAFSLCDCLEVFREVDVPINNIRLGGGGARSNLWCQIQADIFEHGVDTIEVEEGAAFGAALLAGVGAKAWNSIDEACEAAIRVNRKFQPDPAASKVLKGQYERYKMIYPAVSKVMEKFP